MFKVVQFSIYFKGVTFLKFVAHTLPGVILTSIQSCIYLRVIFRKMDSLRLTEPKEVKELRREIKVWQRAANAITSFSKDADLVRETLCKKVKILKHTLRQKRRGVGSTDAYVHTLEDLKLKVFQFNSIAGENLNLKFHF